MTAHESGMFILDPQLKQPISQTWPLMHDSEGEALHLCCCKEVRHICIARHIYVAYLPPDASHAYYDVMHDCSPRAPVRKMRMPP